eukprot:8725068-Alexandrium_andersonii.AAC.1
MWLATLKSDGRSLDRSQKSHDGRSLDRSQKASCRHRRSSRPPEVPPERETGKRVRAVSYTHLRAHETSAHL